MAFTSDRSEDPDLDCLCERCGKPLDRSTAVMLELNCTTGLYSKAGSVPEDESQGGFFFGPDCAAAVLKAGGKNRRIGVAAR